METLTQKLAPGITAMKQLITETTATATEEAICLGLGKQSTKLVMVHAYYDVLHEKYTTTLKCTIP